MVTRIGPAKPFKVYLVEWRKKRGLSQEQLANRLDTTKATISRWETGERDLTSKAIAALAACLNIEPEQMFFDPERPSADALLQGASSQTVNRALRLIQTLVDEDAKTGTDG